MYSAVRLDEHLPYHGWENPYFGAYEVQVVGFPVSVSAPLTSYKYRIHPGDQHSLKCVFILAGVVFLQ